MSLRASLRHPLSLAVVFSAACSEPTAPPQSGSAVASAATEPLAALAANTWSARAPYPFLFGSYGPAAGVVPNAAGQSVVYLLGGTNDEGGSGVSIWAYNVATNMWTTRSYEPRVYVFNSNGIGKIGGKLYISGGYDYSVGSPVITNELLAYEPGSNRLVRMASMPKRTADGVTGVIGGLLYVLPGTCSGDSWPRLDSCETEPFRRLFRYNPATNRWATKRPAPHYHRGGAGGVINGKFYVAGGKDDRLRPVTALDRYDPATDTWTTLAPLPTGGPAIGAVLQGKLYVVVQGDYSVATYAYNPGTNSWSAKASPVWGHAAMVPVTLDGRPRLLAVAGYREPWNPVVNDTELYTP